MLQFALPDFADKDSVKSLLTTANEKGYTTESVINLHTISHNSEFYAAGRLVRSPEGKLRKFLGIPEIVEQFNQENGKKLLVLVPIEFLQELTERSEFDADVLKENGDLAIVLVSQK